MTKSGYGSPEEILKMPTDLVLLALGYEKFLRDYEDKFIELNKRD